MATPPEGTFSEELLAVPGRVALCKAELYHSPPDGGPARYAGAEPLVPTVKYSFDKETGWQMTVAVDVELVLYAGAPRAERYFWILVTPEGEPFDHRLVHSFDHPRTPEQGVFHTSPAVAGPRAARYILYTKATDWLRRLARPESPTVEIASRVAELRALRQAAVIAP